LSIFRKFVEEIQVSLKYEKNKGYRGTVHEDKYTFLREMFRATLVEKITTHFMFKAFFFLKWCIL